MHRRGWLGRRTGGRLTKQFELLGKDLGTLDVCFMGPLRSTGWEAACGPGGLAVRGAWHAWAAPGQPRLGVSYGWTSTRFLDPSRPMQPIGIYGTASIYCTLVFLDSSASVADSTPTRTRLTRGRIYSSCGIIICIIIQSMCRGP